MFGAPAGVGKEAHAASQVAAIDRIQPHDEMAQSQNVGSQNRSEFESRARHRAIQAMQQFRCRLYKPHAAKYCESVTVSRSLAALS
jgi:hypothetical protein